MKIKFSTIILILLCLNTAASAIVVRYYFDKKENISRTETGTFNEDYLFSGQEFTFSGEAEDLVFMGSSLIFTGRTKLGLIALCKDLLFSGSSGNGIIAAGMDIFIDGNVNSTSYIACKTLMLRSRSEVNGSLFVGCAKLVIDGKLNGDLYVGAREIVINNEIKGNVFAHGGRIVFGNNGKINGNLYFSAKEKLSNDAQGRISGAIKITDRNEDKNKKRFGKSFRFIFAIALHISFIIIGSILLSIPVFRKLDNEQSEKNFWNTFLWGLIPVVMYPAVIVLSFALVVTVPLAILLILAFAPLFFMANIIGTTLIGKYLITKLGWKIKRRHYQFFIGALLGLILSLMPYINFLWFLLVSAVGWGVYISFLFNKRIDL